MFFVQGSFQFFYHCKGQQGQKKTDQPKPNQRQPSDSNNYRADISCQPSDHNNSNIQRWTSIVRAMWKASCVTYYLAQILLLQSFTTYHDRSQGLNQKKYMIKTKKYHLCNQYVNMLCWSLTLPNLLDRKTRYPCYGSHKHFTFLQIRTYRINIKCQIINLSFG